MLIVTPRLTTKKMIFLKQNKTRERIKRILENICLAQREDSNGWIEKQKA